MADLREPVDCFDQLKEKIASIPDNQIAVLNMPLEEAMQESRRVAALVDMHRDDLSRADIDIEYLNTVSTRAGAFAYCVSVMDSLVKIKQSHKEQYQALKKEGYALRSNTLKDYEYLFRKNPDVLSAIRNIREGRGDLDMIRDLLSVYRLGTDHRERLAKANYNFTQLERADSLYKELLNLNSQLDTDPKKVEETKLTCMKAWSYLWEALDEIYQAGRYVFRHQPEIEEFFYIDYHQNNVKKRSTPKDKQEIAAN